MFIYFVCVHTCLCATRGPRVAFRRSVSFRLKGPRDQENSGAQALKQVPLPESHLACPCNSILNGLGMFEPQQYFNLMLVLLH